MDIKTTIETIKLNGGENFIKGDQAVIRQALTKTEFELNGCTWKTEDGLQQSIMEWETKDGLQQSIMEWLTYEVDTILSASIHAPFVRKLLELQTDDLNNNVVRNLSNESLIKVFSDLRYAKGSGEFSMYNHCLNKHGFTVYNADIQIEKISHTVKTEIELRMEE